MKRNLLWIVPTLIAIAILIVWGIAKLASGAGAEDESTVRLQAFYDAPSGWYGYKNEAGAVVIPADFEDAAPFSKGVARVKKGGSVFYIDESGQCVRDCPVSSSRPDPGQEDEDDWNAALANGKEEAFNAYLKRFPKGKYSEQARQKLRDFEASRQAARDARDEDRAWEVATTQNTIEAYQAYRRKHPQGKHYQEAGRRIARFEEEIARDEAAWKLAVAQNTVPAFTAYREQFPNGIHYREAEGKIKAIIEKHKQNLADWEAFSPPLISKNLFTLRGGDALDVELGNISSNLNQINAWDFRFICGPNGYEALRAANGCLWKEVGVQDFNTISYKTILESEFSSRRNSTSGYPDLFYAHKSNVPGKNYTYFIKTADGNIGKLQIQGYQTVDNNPQVCRNTKLQYELFPVVKYPTKPRPSK